MRAMIPRIVAAMRSRLPPGLAIVACVVVGGSSPHGRDERRGGGGAADGGRGLDVDVDVSCEDTGSGADENCAAIPCPKAGGINCGGTAPDGAPTRVAGWPSAAMHCTHSLQGAYGCDQSSRRPRLTRTPKAAAVKNMIRL